MRLDLIPSFGALDDLFQALLLEKRFYQCERLAQNLSIAFGQQGAPEVS